METENKKSYTGGRINNSESKIIPYALDFYSSLVPECLRSQSRMRIKKS